MVDPKPYLKDLANIERDCVPGLVEVLQTEGVEGVRYALWDMTSWHEHYMTRASGGAGPQRNRSALAGRCGCGWRRLSPRSWRRPTNGRRKK